MGLIIVVPTTVLKLTKNSSLYGSDRGGIYIGMDILRTMYAGASRESNTFIYKLYSTYTNFASPN